MPGQRPGLHIVSRHVRSQCQRDDPSRRLLAVATKLFAARGYHGTRMDDVADAVGLNKATVYHYYASKSLILYDIYKGALADFTVDALHDDPTASARGTIYHFIAGCWSASPATSSARRCTSGGPYITEWFYRGPGRLHPREGSRSTSTCATSSIAASPAASFTTATRTCSHWVTSG